MSLVDDLEFMRQWFGYSIVLPTPPACQALLEQAKATGIPVGRVFVLSRSLSDGIRGSYDRRSGDIWCHYDSRDNEGARNILQCLLTLIAHVKLQLPPPSTIEEDWEHARLAHEEARALASAWDRDDLFTTSELEAALAYDSHLYLCHTAAGELAGSLNPSIARLAYLALLEVQQRYQWSEAQFEAALNGIREDDEEANAAVLDFDRCSLRAYWLSTRTRKREEEPDPLGQFALAQTPRTARVLRSALEWVASHHTESGVFREPLQVADRTFLSFFRLEEAQDLSLVIAHVNAWLLKDFPECYARVRFSLYADIRWKETTAPSPHLYHMSVEYAHCHEKRQADEGCGPIRRELWVLVPARKREEVVEAAWQRYIRSWLTFADLSTEALYYGLQALWPWLQQ
jgi:hypothetical protein